MTPVKASNSCRLSRSTQGALVGQSVFLYSRLYLYICILRIPHSLADHLHVPWVTIY